MSNWFDVDKNGLSKLLEKKGKAFAIFELVQNCWDTDAKLVTIKLKKLEGRPFATLIVGDNDPNGFADLAHAYTLFAESVKKGDPTKRGRFNIGEKLVLALCKEAKVKSTTGTIIFKEDGTRKKSKEKREEGSCFEALIRMNQQEYDEVCDKINKLIPPKDVKTIFNREFLKGRNKVAEFEATLPTIGADSNGNIFRTKRKTVVEIYNPDEGETPTIYEMGIPVVELPDDKYHLNVMQKVPTNMDRDNVPPKYIRTLRALCLNEIYDKLDEDEVAENWVTDALHHPEVEEGAVESIFTDRYGKKRAIYDPNDVEANHQLVSKGYTIIPQKSFGREALKNIKGAGAAFRSGKIEPTPKPFSDDPNAPVVKELHGDEWTDGMHDVAELVQNLATRILGIGIQVRVVKDGGKHWSACFKRDGVLTGTRLTFNLQGLRGRIKWFDNWKENRTKILNLIIHEFGHYYGSSHLSDDYQNGVTKVGSKTVELALTDSGIFE